MEREREREREREGEGITGEGGHFNMAPERACGDVRIEMQNHVTIAFHPIPLCLLLLPPILGRKKFTAKHMPTICNIMCRDILLQSSLGFFFMLLGH